MSIMQINKAVLAALGNVISGRRDLNPSPDPRISMFQNQSTTGFGTSFFEQYFQGLRAPTLRIRELQYYDYLEREISDVRKALDAFATMAVTGNLAGGGNATFTIRMLDDEQEYPPELQKRLKDMERLFARNAFHITRTMLKYGSYAPEIIVGLKDDNRLGVVRLQPIPPATLFRNVGKDRQNDPDKYWIQMIDGKTVGVDPLGGVQSAGIPQWKMPHFAVWSNVVSALETMVYGTSMLQPFGAIGLKVHAALDATVVARLTRAAMRYVWKIDITDILKDQAAIKKRVGDWSRMMSRSSSLLNDATNTDTYQRTPVPDADFFVPSAKNLGYDLDTITGDTNLARVGDIELLIRFYFGALGIPPEYLGHQRAQGGRSNLSQIDIHFARTVRHTQMFAAAGFEHTAFVDMLLGGWDPRKYPIEIVPPPIGARDDLLQAQIRQLQSTVLANLRAAGFALEVDPQWVLETFLGMDEELEGLSKETIAKLIAKPEMGLGGGAGSGKPGDATTAARVRELLSHTSGELLGVVRENFRLLALNEDPIAGAIYSHDQPSVEELNKGISISTGQR